MKSLVTLPKVHLHVHLESTVRPETARELAAANGVPSPASGPFAFQGFREFADFNSGVRACLVRPEDFHRVAVEFCADEAAQGARYAEAMFTAASHGERLGELEMPLAAVMAGLAEGRRRYGVEVGLFLDHSRRRSVARARRSVELAVRFGAVGVGLAGDEGFPAAPFAQVFEEARAAGLRVVHHAGECAGPESVREALATGSERLGHGFRVLEDPELTARVRELGVALEVCPSSNVVLGLVPSLAEHPLPRLVAAGLVVTLNTDIPNVTGMTLVDEFEVARSVFGFGDDVLAGFAAASVRASFASEGLKRELLAGVAAWSAA
ncbi:Adenosine deaminase [Alloactinosynnema sp. L-07]|uniref:adenosine deaminase n=1 Tax=Alloactinosynnema sp. L-07 TaxID=1653480 RepID=UPI00065EF920|nr:adenosine deaminase [Alloactinosynnema sp. L-07]CRK57129.1 Adenosine deaminase [Alloactinosynnema sp. L-07]